MFEAEGIVMISNMSLKYKEEPGLAGAISLEIKTSINATSEH